MVLNRSSADDRCDRNKDSTRGNVVDDSMRGRAREGGPDSALTLSALGGIN